MLQINGDLEDLEAALQPSYENLPEWVGASHCSALVKLLPGNEDIYVAQDTWTTYQSMLRILKKYDFKFHENLPNGKITSTCMCHILYLNNYYNRYW